MKPTHLPQLQFFVISFLWYACICNAQDDIVDIPDLGRIRGRLERSIGVEREYMLYSGIPYAKPPTGESRFSPPAETGRLVGPDDVFNATGEIIACIQPDGFSFFNPASHADSLEYARTGDERIPRDYEEKRRQNARASLGQEDCLVVNVHTLRKPGDGMESLPVIVFIHGGAFSTGFGGAYSPGKLFRHDVVFVTFNYRLGVQGFFSLDTNEAPGNAALYDMHAALVWVKKYISYFGGNEELITVIGQSAGGAGLSHMITSPLSSIGGPLFHKAVMMSSSGLLPWGTTETPIKGNLRIAELSGCSATLEGTSEPDVQAITQCMLTADSNNLVVALNIYQAEERKAGRLGVDVVSPIIQKAGDVKIVEKHPLLVLRAGEQLDIPVMMGAVRHEGSFPLGIVYNRFLNCPTCGALQNNATFLKTSLVPTLLSSMGVHDDMGAVYDALAHKYLNDRRNSGNFTMMIPGLTDIHSVFFFKAGTYKNLELHSQKNPHSYWYAFDHKGQYSLFMLLFPFPPPPVYGGVAHSDDLMYLFHFFTLNEVDQSISDQMVDYVYNFALFAGDPNIASIRVGQESETVMTEWPAFNTDTTQYLLINNGFSVDDAYMDSWADATLELEPIPPPEANQSPKTRRSQRFQSGQ